MLLIEFAVSAVIIVAAGIFLTRTSENIAEITGLGQMVIGSILLSFATSLPELVTTVSSIRLTAVDLGLGNILGSNMFNLIILALLDLVQGPGPLLLKLTLSHLMSGLIILIMISILGLSLTLYSFTPISPPPFRLAPESIILVLVFLAGVKLMHGYEKKTNGEQVESVENSEKVIPLSEAKSVNSAVKEKGEKNFYQYLIFAISALAILLAGIRLTAAADEIAVITGLGHSFLGAALLAVITSLPELTTTLAAAKNKSYDLAAGNILGSYLFNLLLLAVADLFQPGSLIAAASSLNFLPIFSLIMMIALLMAGLFYRSEFSLFYLGLSPVLILVLYLITLWLMFALRNIPII